MGGTLPVQLPSAAAYRAELIERHLPLVHYVARRFVYAVRRNAVVDYDDLVGYGTEGLIYAAEHFDPSRGFQFSTFAGLHIRTTIQDALRELDPITPPMRRRGAQIEQTRTTLEHEQGTLPSDTAVATALGLNVQQVRYGRRQSSMLSVSLEEAAEETAERGTPVWLASLADTDPDGDPAAVADLGAQHQLLTEALASLPERDRGIVVAHFFHGQCLRAIAQHLGISESRVSHLCARALRKLRDHLTAELQETADERLAA